MRRILAVAALAAGARAFGAPSGASPASSWFLLMLRARARDAKETSDPRADPPGAPRDSGEVAGAGDCAAIAAELEYAKLEIAALEHDNELLLSENKILVNERDLPGVVADIREYIGHVMDGDDVVAPPAR